MNLVFFLTCESKQIRTHFARPDWQRVFSQIARTHQGSEIGKVHIAQVNSCI